MQLDSGSLLCAPYHALWKTSYAPNAHHVARLGKNYLTYLFIILCASDMNTDSVVLFLKLYLGNLS